MRPYKVNFELNAVGLSALKSQVRRKCGMALYSQILVAFKCKFGIFFSLVCQIFKVKGNLAHVQSTFHLRIMVRICFVLVFASDNRFLFMKILDLSDTYLARQFDSSIDTACNIQKRHGKKLFFIKMVSLALCLALLLTSLIFEGLIVFGFNTT